VGSVEAGAQQRRSGGRGSSHAAIHRGARSGRVSRREPGRPSGRPISPATGEEAIHTESRWEAAAAGDSTVRDRGVQGPKSTGTPAKIVIEPIFEADFLPSSYGFRPKKSATQALEVIREAGNRGHNFVVDADIRSYLITSTRIC